MKISRTILASVLLCSFVAVSSVRSAPDSTGDKKDQKAKPYPLKTCIVSGEKLGGDMGDPYVFTHEGREIKLCCKSCLKDFNKDSAKYVKKIEAAEKKAKQ